MASCGESADIFDCGAHREWVSPKLRYLGHPRCICTSRARFAILGGLTQLIVLRGKVVGQVAEEVKVRRTVGVLRQVVGPIGGHQLVQLVWKEVNRREMFN